MKPSKNSDVGNQMRSTHIYAIRVESKVSSWANHLITSYLCLFAEVVQAYFEAWIIGDSFLHDIANSFFALRNAAILNKKSPPFLFERFNISAYFNTTSSMVKGLACFIHPLVEALNEKQRLPKYILVIADKDIATTVKYADYGSTYLLGSAIYYIVRLIDIMLERHKLELYDKKPGAVLDNQPKIIWVRMLEHPQESLKRNKILALRNKFNAVLEETLASNAPNLHLMSIDVNKNDFDLLGNLTAFGKTMFWKELDRGLKKFDQGLISLHPRKPKAESSAQSTRSTNQISHSSGVKLPTPPPLNKTRYNDNLHHR